MLVKKAAGDVPSMGCQLAAATPAIPHPLTPCVLTDIAALAIICSVLKCIIST